MSNAWELPTSINVGGENWNIRTDYRAILDILKYFNDPDYEDDEKWIICLDILYKDFEKMPTSLYEESAEKAVEFIDMGIQDDGRNKPHVMDWEYDAPIIIPAINKVQGVEIRTLSYMHWWTFLGAYMSIGEGLFAEVLNIRIKKSKGKKLEKYEQEFYKENKSLIDLNIKPKRSKEEEEALRKLFGLKR